MNNENNESMNKQLTIALVAHDKRKADMVEWAVFNADMLSKHKLICTGTTGGLIQKALEDKGYTFAATVEQTTRSFGSTKTASGEWIDVVLAVLWLKTNIRERVFATVANSEKLPYETEGAAAIEADIRSVIAEAQGYNIVADDTPISVTTPNVLDLTPAQRNSRILPNVRFTCRLSGAINGTVIRGEVYA